ncbi:MAG: hypothetical protein ABIQ16_19690 [Polyangiaceae bacterium]
MAYVGTVSIVDEHGEALVTRRYAAPACDDAGTLVAKMTADVRAAVRRDPNLAVGTVQDGAPEMWALTRAGLSKLREQGVIARWEEGIDRYHLLERLGAALELIEPNATERSRQLSEWNERLDAQDSAIDSIERYLESHYAKLTSGKRDQLWEHLVYIANNKDRMRYVALSSSHLPIGSGITESAAKTVVGRRARTAVSAGASPDSAAHSRCAHFTKVTDSPAFGPICHAATSPTSLKPHDRDPYVVHTQLNDDLRGLAKPELFITIFVLGASTMVIEIMGTA